MNFRSESLSCDAIARVLQEISDEEDLDGATVDLDFSDGEDEIINYSDIDHDSETDQEGEYDCDNDNDLTEREFIFGKDGETMWCNTRFFKTTSKTKSKNLVKIFPGPKGAAKNVTSEVDAFLKIINDDIIDQVVHYTNIYIQRKRDEVNYSRERDGKLTSRSEIIALIGVLFLIGVKGGQHTNVCELWTTDGTGIMAVRSCMSSKRFLFLLRCVRFDDKHTRSDRQRVDRLAAVRILLETFVTNCKSSYTPSEFLTIDEKLVPFRGRCSFIQYIPKKPSKIWAEIICTEWRQNIFHLFPWALLR